MSLYSLTVCAFYLRILLYYVNCIFKRTGTHVESAVLVSFDEVCASLTNLPSVSGFSCNYLRVPITNWRLGVRMKIARWNVYTCSLPECLYILYGFIVSSEVIKCGMNMIHVRFVRTYRVRTISVQNTQSDNLAFSRLSLFNFLIFFLFFFVD